MEELIFTKTKHGYRCSDCTGRSVEAPTKDIARNQWYIKYSIKPFKQNGFDMTQFNNKLNLGE